MDLNLTYDDIRDMLEESETFRSVVAELITAPEEMTEERLAEEMVQKYFAPGAEFGPSGSAKIEAIKAFRNEAKKYDFDYSLRNSKERVEEAMRRMA